nr:uncharacterized protein LOC117276715 [Nicotiana tomentosiformis]
MGVLHLNDARYIIDCNWHIFMDTNLSKFLLGQLDDLVILYTYREQNQIVDLLAKNACHMDNTAGITVFSQPPSFVQLAPEQDRSGTLFVRRVALSALQHATCPQTPLSQPVCNFRNMDVNSSSNFPRSPFVTTHYWSPP